MTSRRHPVITCCAVDPVQIHLAHRLEQVEQILGSSFPEQFPGKTAQRIGAVLDLLAGCDP